MSCQWTCCRCILTAQAEAIEFVIVEDRISLWYNAIEIATLASKINEDLERDGAIPRNFSASRRE
jgi:hypothetical protein